MKMKKLALYVVLSAGVLSVAVAAALGIIQGLRSDTPLVLAQSEPEPLTDTEFEEFVGDVCNGAEIWLVDSRQETETGGKLYIQWDVADYDGPHTGPRFDGWELTYRIERRSVWGDKGWEQVEDIKTDRSWSGESAEGGELAYRVIVLAVSLGDRTMKCVAPPITEETWFYIIKPPTEAQIEDFRRQRCEDMEITYLEGSAEWDLAYLHWETNVANDWNPESEHYMGWDTGWGLMYRVDRQLDGETTWTTAGTEVLDIELWPHFGGVWEGKAEPGKQSYRVAMTGITVAEQVYPCRGALRWSDAVSVETPTVEERAKIEGERAILVAEAKRCAQEVFTRNISEEALPVVNRHLEGVMLDESGEYPRDPQELVALTVIMCSLVDGANGGVGSGFEFLMFFDMMGFGSW